jgi:hypothetical protein
MPLKERNQHLRVVGEILTRHLPEILPVDPDLARDLLSVAATALQAIADDAESSAKAWDKRAYDLRADELRREWGWAAAAANYALGLVLRPQPLQQSDLDKLRRLIRHDLERPARRQIADPARFRGAAAAVRQLHAQRKKPVRG